MCRGLVTGSNKQVATSLPRGPAVMMRRGGAAESNGVNGGTRSSSIPLLAGKNKSQQERAGTWVLP